MTCEEIENKARKIAPWILAPTIYFGLFVGTALFVGDSIWFGWSLSIIIAVFIGGIVLVTHFLSMWLSGEVSVCRSKRGKR